MPYFSEAILGFSGIFSGTNDIFLGQILQNSGTLGDILQVLNELENNFSFFIILAF